MSDVREPEQVALDPGGLTVIVWGARDRMSIIDVRMIQSIEMLAHRGGGNGKHRRRAG